jgi:hypothetical protein
VDEDFAHEKCGIAPAGGVGVAVGSGLGVVVGVAVRVAVGDGVGVGETPAVRAVMHEGLDSSGWYQGGGCRAMAHGAWGRNLPHQFAPLPGRDI